MIVSSGKELIMCASAEKGLQYWQITIDIRIFDVSVDISEPEQSFDLSPAIQKPKDQPKIGFSLDDDDNTDEDAFAFTLGNASTATSGWESFTIFYTLRSGHIYALCPVIPYRR